jgi:Wiskott-Aldrich syndrome protein
MEHCAQKLLESTIHKTLHAHAFSRSSTQATVVLTDLLSRYLTLLTSTCAKYAQHAGRNKLTIYDALEALEELGASMEDLNGYGSGEGKELNRYALHSPRRQEELNEFRCMLLYIVFFSHLIQPKPNFWRE